MYFQILVFRILLYTNPFILLQYFEQICHKKTRDGPNLPEILTGSKLREQGEECCYTNRFNKAYYPDFRQGLETEYKEDSILGKCFNFTFNYEKSIVKAHHEGKVRLLTNVVQSF